jgi:PPOX class probable F420-dependent enzyme
MTTIPKSHRDLLERPLIAQLATVRGDGTPQVNPTWVRFDGHRLGLTTTRGRQKVRNWQRHPFAALSILDPYDPDRYLEIRGRVEQLLPDPDAAEYLRLAKRYRLEARVPADAAERIAVAIRPMHTTSA